MGNVRDKGKIPPRPTPRTPTHKNGIKRGYIEIKNRPIELRRRLMKIQGLRSSEKSARMEIPMVPISCVKRKTVSNRPDWFADQPSAIYMGDSQDRTE